jgi:uncharacterized membrane protein
MGLSRPVTKTSDFTDVVPLPDNIYSDGRAIIFEWERYNIEGDFAVYIRYIKPYEREKKLYVAGLLLLVLVAGGYYLLKLKRRKPEVEDMEDDKKMILDLIKANEGIVQKKIVDITGFSKSKVSMIISNLERDGLIRKERLGLKNRLYLTKKCKKS